jgi:3',5'-cyclic AMP phosphodiesterase CpdA
MFRLAHISDIHLGLERMPSLRELASKRITGYVNWHRNRRKVLFGDVLDTLMADIQDKAPDHLAITCDMVNLATDREVATAAAWLKTAGAPDFASLVPGNHDAYVLGAYDKVSKAWRNHMISDDGRSIRSGDSLFPFLRVRDKVAIIGVSTATATPPFFASGYFGVDQARRTALLLDKAKKANLFRIVLIHHPPVRRATLWHKRMVGIGRFTRVMREHGAELVLHGHTHLNTLLWQGDMANPVPVVGIASASQGPGSEKPAATYNLLSIDEKDGAWRCRLERHQLTADSTSTQKVIDDIIVGPDATVTPFFGVPPAARDEALTDDPDV